MKGFEIDTKAGWIYFEPCGIGGLYQDSKFSCGFSYKDYAIGILIRRNWRIHLLLVWFNIGTSIFTKKRKP
jgi:hypothetical protein